MERPEVICHIFATIDGRIEGAYMGAPAAVPAREAYARLQSGFDADALAYGVRAAAVGRYFPCGLFGREPVLPSHEEGDSNDEYREYGYEYYVYHYFVSSFTVQLCRLRR